MHQKYIHIWNNSHRIPTNTGRRFKTIKITRKSTTYPVGWNFLKKESGQALHPWEGAVKEERFPHSGNTLHWLRDQQGQKGSFRSSEESAVTRLQLAEQRQTSTNGPCHLAAFPSLKNPPAGVCRGWVLKLRLQQTDPGRWLGLAVQRQTKGAGSVVWAANRGVLGWSPGPPKKRHC